MIELTKRQRDILCTLIKADDYMTLDALAETFNVSKRTIQNDLNYIESNNINLIKKPSYGIKVDGDIEKYEELIKTFENRFLDKNERIDYIIIHLLNENNTTYLKIADVLIVHSVSGRNPVGIEIAKLAKEKGAKVIVLTNLTYSKTVSSRHPSSKKLYEFADIIIDNHGVVGDACVEIKGVKQKVAPTSSVIACVVMNSIVAALTQKLVDNGMENPPIFYSANIDGGAELNKKLYEKYKDSIHYKF